MSFRASKLLPQTKYGESHEIAKATKCHHLSPPFPSNNVTEIEMQDTDKRDTTITVSSMEKDGTEKKRGRKRGRPRKVESPITSTAKSQESKEKLE